MNNPAQPESPRAEVLRVSDLHKTFVGPDERIEVLRGANFQVSAGESVSIRGESGAGKSTLLYLVAGMEAADAGSLWWDGEEATSRTGAWMARRRALLMGFVFQAYYLVPELNALENVVLAARLAGRSGRAEKARASELLERVGLTKRARHLPSQLSGGERQRVAIARALVNRPRLILADEPTGNLDENTSEEVISLLLNLCSDEGASLILVTHNVAHATRTDRQLYMRSGLLETI